MQATVKQQVMVVSGIMKLFPVNVTIFGAVKKRKKSQPVTITTNVTTTVIAIGAKSHNKTTMPTSSQSLALQSSLGFPHLS